MYTSPPGADVFSFGFGVTAPGSSGAGMALPVLAGATGETLFGDLEKIGPAEGFELFGSGDWLVGVRSEPARPDIGAQTEAIYRDLLRLARARERRPVRIWNYVPQINAASAEGLETYQVFCRGRALGYERAGWDGPLPAASAVGGAPGVLVVMFAAARAEPIARENPEQVPAYEYPAEYGPRSPSFSRAMQVAADGRRWTFVSGTAAIKGHETMAAEDLPGQIDCTLDNLRLVSRECGLGDALGDTGAERHFKVYLRHEADLDPVRTVLETRLLRPGDRVSWLHSDICRAALRLEIEATLVE